MRRRPPRATRTDTLFPDTTLFRAAFASTGRRAQSGLGKARGARSIFLPPVSLRQHGRRVRSRRASRSEEHTSELQSLMRISYAAFCLKKNNSQTRVENIDTTQNHTPIPNTHHITSPLYAKTP